MRIDQRLENQLRPVKLTANICEYAEGSCLVEFGKTKVFCTATYEAQGPKWLQNTGQGWVTAEYGMLPRSTQSRMKREKIATGGRTQEISRLIGRSLRSAINMDKLGERQITLDCDVINADGGTRTAAITGGFVALALCLEKLVKVNEIKTMPLVNYIAAVSVGLKNEKALLDLNYDEDSSIGTDMNFVMTDLGHFVEMQGTAEQEPFTKLQLQQMIDVAHQGCIELFKKQSELVGHILKPRL